MAAFPEPGTLSSNERAAIHEILVAATVGVNSRADRVTTKGGVHADP